VQQFDTVWFDVWLLRAVQQLSDVGKHLCMHGFFVCVCACSPARSLTECECEFDASLLLSQVCVLCEGLNRVKQLHHVAPYLL